MVKTYVRHDPNAVYRSLVGWARLGSALHLRLRRLIVLHRVPIHVYRETSQCDLGYAPMAYLLWERKPMRSSNKGALAAEPAPVLTSKQWRRDRWREEVAVQA